MAEIRLPCDDCKHLNRKALKEDPFSWGTCKAFPEGIPSSIWAPLVIPPAATAHGDQHREPIEGDHGIQWEQLA